MNNDLFDTSLPVRIYKKVTPSPDDVSVTSEELLAKFTVFLPDRPGSLAGFSSDIAVCGGNIAFFHYDRALDSNRVAVEVQFDGKENLGMLLQSLSDRQYAFEESPVAQDEVQILSEDNILEIKVRLINKPGSLAAFANLLKDHQANVIYMLYDEDIDPESADIAMATEKPEEVDRLLNAVNEEGHHYRVIYKGADEQGVAHIIGLKLVEKFFLRLLKLLPESDVEEIKSLIESSRDLHSDLVHFYQEAGNDLEAGDVFEKVLALASRSRSQIRDRFFAGEMTPLKVLDGVTVYGFRLPTSENIYVFQHDEELTMIDAGHGIYFEDFCWLLRSKSLDPAQVRRMFITHADTDHIGTAGYFEQRYGTQIYLHPGSEDVVRHMNRAYGLSGRLANLNKYYTRLSNTFTACRFPERPNYFSTKEIGNMGGFHVIERFFIGPLEFDVLESLGGHAPGQVFYLNREYGLLFTSDFLLNVPSLSPDEREHLSLYRYLLTNPNSDTQVFKEEMEALKEIALSLDKELNPLGKSASIFPGHGDYYRVTDMKTS